MPQTRSPKLALWVSKRHNEGIIYVFGPGPHRDNIYKSFKADLDNLEQVSGPDNFSDWDLVEYFLGPQSR